MRRSSATRWAAPSPPPSPKLRRAARQAARDHRPGARRQRLRNQGPAAHRRTHLPAGDRPGASGRITPDFAVKDGLGVAFAPGYDVPDAFVDDFKRHDLHLLRPDGGGEDDYMQGEHRSTAGSQTGRRASSRCLRSSAPKSRSTNPEKALAAYAKVPGAETELIAGAGHSPNVEKPARDRGAGPRLRGRDRRNPGTNCKKPCRTRTASEHVPKLRTHVRFKDITDRTADRRRRPADRLRHARRVRPGAGRASPARAANRASAARTRPGTRPRGSARGRDLVARAAEADRNAAAPPGRRRAVALGLDRARRSSWSSCSPSAASSAWHFSYGRPGPRPQPAGEPPSTSRGWRRAG